MLIGCEWDLPRFTTYQYSTFNPKIIQWYCYIYLHGDVDEGYTLWQFNNLLSKIAIEIVDLPMKNCDFP